MLRTNVATAVSSSWRGYSQAVDGGLGGVKPKGILRLPAVGAQQRVKHARVELDPFRRHAAEEGFHDVRRPSC